MGDCPEGTRLSFDLIIDLVLRYFDFSCSKEEIQKFRYYILYKLSLFFLDCIHMLGGVPQQGGLPRQRVWVTHFDGVSFFHVKAAEWGNPPNWG